MTGNSIKSAEKKSKKLPISRPRRRIHFTCKLRAGDGKGNESIASVVCCFRFRSIQKCNEEMDHKSADVYIIPLHEKPFFLLNKPWRMLLVKTTQRHMVHRA